MFVIFKNEQGTYSVRPAFIGFIKNDTVRRILCSIAWPFTVLFTILINLIQAAIVIPFVLLSAVFYPLLKLKPIWKTEIWSRARTKADSNSKLD